MYYFVVVGVNDAMLRVKGGGGQIISGPHQAPGGSWIVQCVDPQGAIFALTSARA